MDYNFKDWFTGTVQNHYGPEKADEIYQKNKDSEIFRLCAETFHRAANSQAQIVHDNIKKNFIAAENYKASLFVSKMFHRIFIHKWRNFSEKYKNKHLNESERQNILLSKMESKLYVKLLLIKKFKKML